MATRRMIAELMNEWGGMILGYGLFDDQTMPETYLELIAFMVDRLKIDSDDPSIGALEEWLLKAGVDPSSCSPELDAAHVEAVVLIGELMDPDRYVAELPIGPMGMLPIPPAEVVRALIASEAT